MSSLKKSFVAIERPGGLDHQPGGHAPIWNPPTSRGAPAIELRMARDHDADVVRRLADLDSAPKLVGQVLIAIIDGEAAACLSLLDQRIVANPFVSTFEAVSLLRLRAAQLRGARKRRGLQRTPPLARTNPEPLALRSAGDDDWRDCRCHAAIAEGCSLVFTPLIADGLPSKGTQCQEPAGGTSSSQSREGLHHE